MPRNCGEDSSFAAAGGGRKHGIGIDKCRDSRGGRRYGGLRIAQYIGRRCSENCAVGRGIALLKEDGNQIIIGCQIDGIEELQSCPLRFCDIS